MQEASGGDQELGDMAASSDTGETFLLSVSQYHDNSMFGTLDHPLEEVSVLQRTMGQKSKVSELSNTKLGATKVHCGEWEWN